MDNSRSSCVDMEQGQGGHGGQGGRRLGGQGSNLSPLSFPSP